MTNLSNTDSIPILSPPSSQERKETEGATQSAIAIYQNIIMDNIEYSHLIQNPRFDRELLDEIVDLLVNLYERHG